MNTLCIGKWYLVNPPFIYKERVVLSASNLATLFCTAVPLCFPRVHKRCVSINLAPSAWSDDTAAAASIVASGAAVAELAVLAPAAAAPAASV